MKPVLVRRPDVHDADDIGRVHVRAWQAAYRGLIDDDSLDGLSVPARQSYRHAVLWVLDGNRRARRFYEREGWAFDGATKVDDRFGPGVRELRYGRPLPPPRTEW